MKNKQQLKEIIIIMFTKTSLMQPNMYVLYLIQI